MSVVLDMSVLPIISVVIAGISLYLVYVKGIREQEQRWSGVNDRLTKLETKMELIWNYVDDNMGKILHSPHTPEIDALLEKMPPWSAKPLLSLFEAEKLRCLLIPDWQKETDIEKKRAYGLYLARLDSLILDRKAEARGR